MNIPETRKYKQATQHLISVGLVLLISATCFISVDFIGYRVVALILMVTVSLLAMLFDILPVLVAAVLSALVLNFFFIPPLYTFHIDTAEDLLMLVLYLIIALVNGVLTHKIRDAERRVRDKEESESIIRLYNTLLNSLSHELRTPVSTIIGAVDTLKESNGRLSMTIQGELLAQIGAAGLRLNGQVENLLNMSRLESGMLKLNLDWCDVNELIFSVVRKLSSTDSYHKIMFSPNENLPLFKLDTGLMEQVFYNIVCNAVQYTPEGTIVRISAFHESENCVVTIADNGKGIPENEMKLVFDKFYRLPEARTGGSGLGLSIAKGFSEAHNGKITLEKSEEGGAKFTITIPAESSFMNNLKNE